MTRTEATSSTRRAIEIEVPETEVSRETDQLIQKYQKLARIPGFRRGHVPASVIRQRFSQEIQGEVVEALVPRYFRMEAERLGLVPVSPPEVSEVRLEPGRPLAFKATFEVMPEIKVEGYRELRGEHPAISVSDSEVEDSLHTLQEKKATFAAVEGRSIRDGDYAQVSLDGTPQSGEPAAKPVHMDNLLVEIGGRDTMPEFTENLRGSSPGEERTFPVRYPEDFRDQRLRGRTFTYRVKVNAVKQKTLPELNHDFAKEVGEFQTLEELRAKMREAIERERRARATREAKDKLLDELVRRNDFEVPDSIIERQIEVRLERGLRALAAQGIGSEYMKKLDLPRLRAEQREAARAEVKSALLLEKVADLEGIEVRDEEVDREIEALARQTDQTADQIRARLTRDGALDRIRSRIRNEKALDFLYHQSA